MNKNALHILAFASTLQLAASSGVCAQDHGKQFYDKDYAREIMAGKGNVRKSPTGAKSQTAPLVPGAKDDSGNFAELDAQPDQQQALVEAPALPINGTPAFHVKSVGAILNAKDLNATVNQVYALVLKHKLSPADFYVVGGAGASGTTQNDPKAPAIINDATVKATALAILGARFMPTQNLPEQYKQVTHTPTWIVRGDKEEVLIESVKQLSPYLNDNGEVILPK